MMWALPTLRFNLIYDVGNALRFNLFHFLVGSLIYDVGIAQLPLHLICCNARSINPIITTTSPIGWILALLYPTMKTRKLPLMWTLR